MEEKNIVQEVFNKTQKVVKTFDKSISDDEDGLCCGLSM